MSAPAKASLTAMAERLRELLEMPGCLHIPTCFDALSAVLTRRAGFPLTFMSGSWVAASRLGSPDVGLITQSEMTDQLRNVCAAVEGMPVLADGDTGYGNAMNVRRTVIEYARAGAAAVMIEDQVEPKRCGHFEGKAVIPRAEARMKIRAAVEAARKCGVLIVARTDARAVEGFDAAMARCEDFVEEGADIIFLEAPASALEMKDFARRIPKPTVANVVPGGKSPLLSHAELEDCGFKLAVYHPLLFAAVRAMQAALEALRTESRPGALALGFDEMKQIVGLPEYERESALYRS
ncbi:MAG: isocitrate lyase/PEP mutase family protein [Candidatus Binatia bacterium]